MKIVIIFCNFLFLLNVCYGVDATIFLSGTWKFRLGDSLAWCQPTFVDSDWYFIGAPQIWENAGFANYDGYAWYRKGVYIPADWQNNKYVNFKNILYLKLGQIDDVDQTFFNGQLIGETGSFPPDYESQWNIPRLYHIPLNLVKWDQENIVAIRVYDHRGNGGIYAGEIVLQAPNQMDYVNVQVRIHSPDHIFPLNKKLEADAVIENNSFDSLKGEISWKVVTDDNLLVNDLSQSVLVDIGKSLKRNAIFKLKEAGIYQIHTDLGCQNKVLFHTTQTVGYNVENIKPKLTRQRDFEEFWERTSAQLSQIPMQAKIELIDSLCTQVKNVYQVRLLAFDDIYIYGWYTVSTRKGTFPAILEVPGYSSSMRPQLNDFYKDFAVLSLDIRGHGDSRGEINPGFPGYLLWNIDNKEKYIYRGAFMDCIRGLDFLCSRAEVDTSRIAVCGGSQGGALTLATAALDHRVKLAAPDVPFLAFFEAAVKLALWPYHEIVQYVIEHPNQKKIIFRNLSYFDVMNLAPWIECPVLMSIGLRDKICPPRTNFAVFNYINAPKEYRVYPDAAHEGGGPLHAKIKAEWIKKHFGIE